LEQKIVRNYIYINGYETIYLNSHSLFQIKIPYTQPNKKLKWILKLFLFFS